MGRSRAAAPHGILRSMSFMDDALRDGMAMLDTRGVRDKIASLRAANPDPSRTCPCIQMCNDATKTNELPQLSHIQNPDAPVDHYAELRYCLTCGRGWLIETSGDSHYSYSCSGAGIDLLTGRRVG